MNEKYQRMLDLGIEVTNKFSYGTKEYQLGEKIIAFACERNRQEEKVILSEPNLAPRTKQGLLEEKIRHEYDEYLFRG